MASRAERYRITTENNDSGADGTDQSSPSYY